jgi:hypothetical protein
MNARLLRTAAGGLLLGLTACTAVFHPARLDDTSREFEPPGQWEAAIEFSFTDSTFFPASAYGAHVEFFDGRRYRRAEGNDVFLAENGAVRTPWHRVWTRGSHVSSVPLRITIGDPAGERTTAEYPLDVKPDDFYTVHFVVATHAHAPPSPWDLDGLRGYPVPPGARSAPGDSLWVGYRLKGRYCFNCPS